MAVNAIHFPSGESCGNDSPLALTTIPRLPPSISIVQMAGLPFRSEIHAIFRPFRETEWS